MIKKFASITLCLLFSFANLAFADRSCLDAINRSEGITKEEIELFQNRLKSLNRKERMAVKAEQLAELVAVDNDTRKLISNPIIAQFLYLHFFAEEANSGELRQVLQEIASASDLKGLNLLNLVEDKLSTKLNSAEVKEKIAALLTTSDKDLRPTKWKEKTAKWKADLKQFLAMPKSILKIKKLVNDGFSQQNMDEGLFHFWGATQLGLSESQMRPWSPIKGGIDGITPNDVDGISPYVWSLIASMASETELPIEGYSWASGESLRALLPSVSRFMGKTTEQHLYTQEKKETEGEGIYFCRNVWCSEENRHERYVQDIADGVGGIRRVIPKTYEAEPPSPYSDIDAAIKHLVGRNSSEWNANSVYFFLRGHSHAGAEKGIDNVRADETKHMAIFSAAFTYLFGDQPYLRTKGMLEKILRLKNGADESYGQAEALNTEVVSLIELAVTHLFVEQKTRSYMKNLPLKTMEKLFETPVKTITEAESVEADPFMLADVEKIAKLESNKRNRLERWSEPQRSQYLALKEVEKKHSALIESYVRHVFENFSGAELYDSAEARLVLKKIKSINTGLDMKRNDLIKLSLTETLRDYQIMNTDFVRSRPDLVVLFKSAAEGFVVERAKGTPVKVLGVGALTSNHTILKVAKPTGLNLEPGVAVSVSLQTKNGIETRVLSLANSPSQDYLEFAVGNSDTDFKQKIKVLTESDYLYIRALPNQLPFIADKPAVMIAGGIGITPFRSMIQYSIENQLANPIWLLYGNRSEIPFGQELERQQKVAGNLNVTHTLTAAPAGWEGETGRIDKEFLAARLPQYPDDAIFYIVGNRAMTRSTQLALIDLGVDASRIRVEAFGPIARVSEDSKVGSSKEEDSKEEEKVCFCMNVTSGAITKVINEGASSVEEISSKTCAGTACGKCLPRLGQMLKCTK